jgi:hypothetical protein
LIAHEIQEFKSIWNQEEFEIFIRVVIFLIIPAFAICIVLVFKAEGKQTRVRGFKSQHYLLDET